MNTKTPPTRHVFGTASNNKLKRNHKLNSIHLGIEIVLSEDGLHFIYLDFSIIIYNNLTKVTFPPYSIDGVYF